MNTQDMWELVGYLDKRETPHCSPQWRAIELGTFLDIPSALQIAKDCEYTLCSVRPLRPATPHLSDVLTLLTDDPFAWADCCPDERMTIGYPDDLESEVRTKLDEAVNEAIARVLQDYEIGACDYTADPEFHELGEAGWVRVPSPVAEAIT